MRSPTSSACLKSDTDCRYQIMAKLNQGYVANKRWSLDRHDVSLEVLEDMGVSLLDDDSSSDCQQRESELEPPAVTEKRKEPPISPLPQEDWPDNFLLTKRKRVEGPPGADGFSRLSDEIILCVFRWLPKATIARCAQVSKRWKRLAYDEALWRRLDLSGVSLKPTVLGTVLMRGTQVLRLAKTEVCDPIYDANAPALTRPSMRNLQYLDLSMAAVSCAGLAELLRWCRSLRKLSLEHCVLDDSCCRYLATNGQLEALNMSMCHGVTETALTAIAAGCTQLDSWNLAWAKLDEPSLHVLCVQAPATLQRINLSGCRQTLTDQHVKALCERCPRLVELDVSDASLVTQTSVVFIHENLRRLEYLAMSRCYGVQISAFLVFQKSELLYLDVFGLLTEPMLQTLRSKLPHIEINKFFFSSVARPTVGIRRTSIWGLKVRE